MGEEGISLEGIIKIGQYHDRDVKLYIGRVKDKNDFSLKFESGVWTIFSYKTPLTIFDRDYSDVSVVSFMVDENHAQTNVWGRPVGLSCLNEEKLKQLCKSHKPFELPKIHEQTVEEIESIHYKFYCDMVYVRLEKENLVEAQKSLSYGQVPF